MSKFTQLSLLSITLLSVSSVRAMAFSFNNLNYAVNADQRTVTVTGGSITNSDPLIIPDSAYEETSKIWYPITIIYKQAFQNYQGTKIIIGNNVTTIATKAFQHFGQNTSDCMLVFGKSIRSISDHSFQNLGSNKTTNTKLILFCDSVPAIDSTTFTFAKIQNTTLYVKNDSTYQQYLGNSVWKKLDSQYNINNVKFNQSLPYATSLSRGKWATAVFPEDLSQSDIVELFGAKTRIAMLQSANFDNTKMEYQLKFAYTTTIKANTPYLIKAGNLSADYVSTVSGDPSAASLTQSVNITNKENYKVEMIGVYNKYTLLPQELYLRNDNGNLLFYQAQTGVTSYVNANKCYFKILDASGNPTSAKIDYNLDISQDLETTDIHNINAFNHSNQSVGIYTLYGQYLGTDTSRLPKGIYIINGKKTILK